LSTSLSNGTGSLAQTYTFDSFGNQTASSGSLTSPFQYTARESDPETGLYYYRARYYDPVVGKFLTEDPLNLLVKAAICMNMPLTTPRTLSIGPVCNRYRREKFSKGGKTWVDGWSPSVMHRR